MPMRSMLIWSFLVVSVMVGSVPARAVEPPWTVDGQGMSLSLLPPELRTLVAGRSVESVPHRDLVISPGLARRMVMELRVRYAQAARHGVRPETVPVGNAFVACSSFLPNTHLMAFDGVPMSQWEPIAFGMYVDAILDEASAWDSPNEAYLDIVVGSGRNRWALRFYIEPTLADEC